MKKPIQRPSHDEYVRFVEDEFRFLEAELDFLKTWDSQDAFRVKYSKERIHVSIWGWGYGESGHAGIELDDEEIPYWYLTTPRTTKLSPPTGKSQLDDLREIAVRMRNECRDILLGDFTRLLPFRPFPHAEEMWRSRRWKELVVALDACSKPFNDLWANRYDHAVKNSH